MSGKKRIIIIGVVVSCLVGALVVSLFVYAGRDKKPTNNKQIEDVNSFVDEIDEEYKDIDEDAFKDSSTEWNFNDGINPSKDKSNSDAAKEIITKAKDEADYYIKGMYYEYEDYVINNDCSKIVFSDSDAFNMYEKVYIKYALLYYSEQTGYSGEFEVISKEVLHASNITVVASIEINNLKIMVNIDTDEILIFESK